MGCGEKVRERRDKGTSESLGLVPECSCQKFGLLDEFQVLGERIERSFGDVLLLRCPWTCKKK